MTTLTLDDLTVWRGECPVVDHVSFDVTPGDFIGLIGPNGAGKTTLMRAALGLLNHAGHSSISAQPAHARARLAAWIPQHRHIAWAMSVRDVVALGRTHQGRVTHDDPIVAQALAHMGLLPFAHRTATELSGGEQARVLIARALAQNTPLLLADEPTASLDPENQLSTMETFRALALSGRGVMASIHDLGLAARYCTKLALMHRGRLVAFGPPDEVLSAAHLRDVFHIDAYYKMTDHGPVFQPVSLIAPQGQDNGL